MNDPHVVALIYRVEHDASVSYKQAVPLDYDGDAFKVRVNDDEARFEMKQHFETVEAAQEALEQFIRKWEFSAMLERGPSAFKLLFKNAEIEDRNPTPGHMYVSGVRPQNRTSDRSPRTQRCGGSHSLQGAL